MSPDDPGLIIKELLEAYRTRELPVGGLSMSQASVSCSQGLSWLKGCQLQLEEIDIKRVLEHVHSCDVSDLLKALQALGKAQDTTTAKRAWVELSKECIADPTFTEGRKGKDIISFVVSQVDQLEGQDCVELIESLLQSIGPASNANHERCLELLPKLLSRASKMDQIVVKRAKQLGEARTSQFSGEGYRTAVVEHLCRAEWPRALLVPICTILRDLFLTDEQLKHAITRVAKEASKMEVQELPPLVYQLLLLSAHGQRTQILRMVLSIFAELDEQCKTSAENGVCASQLEIVEAAVDESELIQVEGISILHFTFAVKQDLPLGQELLRLLKMRQCDLSPFEVALLLSLSRIQRYEGKAVEVLRKAAEHDFAHECKIRSSSWIGRLHEMKGPTDFVDVMRHVLRRSQRSWDHVVPGMVSFLFQILELHSRKCSDTDRARDAVGQLAASSFSKTVAGIAVKKTLALIEQAFRAHESIREDVLGQIFARVLTRDASVPSFIAMLASIVRRCSRDVLGYLPKVKEALEYIGYMTPRSAVALVRALEPLLRLQPSLHDYLMIVLRKALFSRETESRTVALDCLLHLSIIPTRVPAASSASQASSQLSGTTEDVGLEIVGQLRRCMAQQAATRQKLYDGLCDVVDAKPQLLEYITSILFQQLQRYCQNNMQGRVLDLAKCLDDGNNIAEPVAHLIRAITHCIVCDRPMPDEGERAATDAARQQMTKLVEWIGSSELQDFDLDRSTHFSRETDEGRKHLSVAKLLLGVFEALLEFDLLCTAVSESSFETRSLKMVVNMQELSDILQENTKGGKGRKPPSSLIDDKATLFTLRFTENILAVTAEDCPASPFPKSVQEAMWRSEKFMPMVIQTAVNQISSAKVAELGPDHRKAFFQAHFVRIAPLLVKQFFAHLDPRTTMPTPDIAKKPKSNEPNLVSLVLLRALESYTQCACQNFSREEVGLMASGLAKALRLGRMEVAGEEVSGGEHDGHITECISVLQCQFLSLLDEDDASMATIVMDILSALGGVLPCSSLEDHLDWTKRACEECGDKNFLKGDLGLAKAVVGSYLHMASGNRDLKEAEGLADDMLSLTVEREEGEEEVEMVAPKSKIVRDDTVPIIIPSVVDQIKASAALL